MNKRERLLLAALFAGGSLLSGCGLGATDGATNGAAGDNVGQVALALQVAGGITVNSFSYTLSGPSMRTGTINVTNSTTVSTLLSAIPVGTGYTVALNATATDGTTTCSGTSSSFSVAAAATTSVAVAIDCNRAHTSGSVLVNGSINVCAEVDGVSAAPPVGATIALTATADDPDNGPGPITYHWTTSSGTISDLTSSSPVLTCTQAGPVNLTLTVSDGDPNCADSFQVTVNCPPESAALYSTFVEIGANNQAIARLIMPYTGDTCPSITVDGTTSPMTLRDSPGTMALRTSSTDSTLAAAMTSGNTKASIFTTTVCEFPIPSGAMHATVAGISLPLPKPVVNRVVVIGDSGCRISIGNVYQNCSDPTIWPFSVISSAAAAMQPDLVLHVGDYQYRDNPCPPGNTACNGTPWGYGSDTWMADIFTPAAPLLAAAPWVMVRGNHETCNRAGQGWYRYLDTNAYDSSMAGTKTCNTSTNDGVGNYNDPWAVAFGDTNIVAFDSSNAAKTAYASAAAAGPYATELTEAAALEPASLLNIFAVHHPVLGYTAGSPPTVGNPALQSIMGSTAFSNFPGNYYPPNTGLAMHGHVHDFQAINFSSNHPATFVAGNGGDNLDTALPATFNPSTDEPAPSTIINSFAFSQEFGFMVMDRVGAVGAKTWKFTSYRTNGTIIAVCNMAAPIACSGTCDSTPGSQITCTDGSGNVVGSYDNIP
jgi:hypothetical protein